MRATLRLVGNAIISFPGFQRILEFVSAGSEASVSVGVSSITNKNFFVAVRNASTTKEIYVRLNNDSGTNYGLQYLQNDAGTITAGRVTNFNLLFPVYLRGLGIGEIFMPSGFVSMSIQSQIDGVTGSTVVRYIKHDTVWNSTASVNSINFISSTGNFDSGSEAIVYTRRSST